MIMKKRKSFFKSRWVWIAIGFFAGIMGIFIYFVQNDSKKVTPEVSIKLTKHPIYSRYEFSNNSKQIYFGTQPLYMPTGLITETIKRDRLFEKALLKLGFKIQYYPYLKGSDVNFFLQSGELDIGIGGDMPFITIASKSNVRSPLKIQEGFISIVARRSMLVSQLKSKKIGYALGSNAHYALLNALKSENINESDVTLMSLNVDQMPEALFKEDIDAFSAWQPTPAMASKKYPGFVTIHKKLTTGYVYFQQNIYDQNPEFIRVICTAILRAVIWIQDKKENLLTASQWAKQAAEKLTGQAFPLSAEEIASLALKDIIGTHTLLMIKTESTALNSNLHQEFGFLKKLKKIPADIQWKQVQSSFDYQLIRELLRNSQKYGLRNFDYDISSRN